MKTSSIFPVKLITISLITGLVNLAAYAQKLPTEQQGGLRAPTNIKIDGKATEWGDQFQAYNNHTDFYYSMANDDNNLYVIIQATNPAIIRRILNGSLTLMVNPSAKKDNKTGASITYPMFDKGNRFILNMAGGRVSVASLTRSIMAGTDGIRLLSDNGDNIIDIRGTAATKSSPTVNTDSLALVNNNSFTSKAKYIGVSGIKNVDTLISVYNQDGIKASALFNNKMAYTYELAIALKHLNLSVSNPIKFTYQLRINAVGNEGVTFMRDNAGNMTGFSRPIGAAIEQFGTDFWGEYTLAK